MSTLPTEARAGAPASRDLRRLSRVRWAVRAVLLLGVFASVAANVLHAEPNIIAQCIAAWPPLALLLVVELISRVPVHRRSLAAVRVVATAVIGSIAAWVSYWHMAGVAQRYGETGPAPYLIPLSVDGLVVVASVCLVELAGRIRTVEGNRVDMPTVAEPAIGGRPTTDDASRGDNHTTEAPNPSGNPSPDADASALVNPPAGPSNSSPNPNLADGPELGDLNRAYALTQLAAGKWTIDEAAAHAGVSVRRFQTWADDVAARTRKQRGGTRKPPAKRTGKGAIHPNTRAARTVAESATVDDDPTVTAEDTVADGPTVGQRPTVGAADRGDIATVDEGLVAAGTVTE